jgi:ATP-binding cassette subfamily B (MDR/TAP) protein 1
MIASMDLNVGTVLTVVLAVMIGAFSLALIGPRIETFAKATAASQKIFQTLQRVPSIDSLDDNGDKPNDIKGNLELKGVSFVYPARPESIPPCYLFFYLINQIFAFKWVLKSIYFRIPLTTVIVLKNVDISIPEGKFTAIVGPSGSGKSTILQLLERFYDPVEGEITLDGHDIRSLNVKFLRSRMGLVSQEPVLFGTSVFENVCHGYESCEMS